MPTHADAEYVLVLLPPTGVEGFGTTIVPDTVVYPVPVGRHQSNLSSLDWTLFGSRTNHNSASPI